MPRFSPLRITALALVPLAFAAPLVSSDARADWPPPADATAADLAAGKYWPSDPGYAFSDSGDGQWNFYSFIPSTATNIRKGETASGMSIDLAWRYTIGDPSVVLAVTDSGVEWDSADIVDRVYLNIGELQNHKPTHADGTPCGGTGAIAGFDCNGDGEFTVSDYAETPTLKPDPDPDTGLIRGDANRNGILDAGDLISNFSDGVDDDGNGYVDDIAGWDFMKDDNDPFDDTRYGHGTGEANDSTAAADNAISDAGVCPKCRFLPMRVGDSFITDVTLFGKAVVYATDNGASVVQCALGTINMNRFAQKALDYAYDKGVLTITSMADENSRHHNLPATANHTLPVHAIEYDNGLLETATTFLAYHPCSNFGGQNFLSASATACSSEATGRLSGIAGLVISASKAFNVAPPLTPGEAQSLFFTTTDDVDVPESQEKDSPYRWSQKGFDQRFGYGRVNANRAIEALKAGKIPPSVDVTSPTWFTVLYADQVQGPVDVVGTVSATRANSFDYVVEWAPGVQPLDDEFQQFGGESNIPAQTVITGPLASLDVRLIDPKHKRDVDSPNGENDTAITVRVRATAHYGGDIGDVRGEMRRTYYVEKDPSLAAGFPMYLGDSGELSPKMADLDGDGIRELIVPTAGGALYVYKLGPMGPVKVPGFPFNADREDGLQEQPPPGVPSYLGAPAYQSGDVDPDYGREPFGMAPAIGDVDGDGVPEIVLSTFPGTMYVVGNDGKVKPGWPVRLPAVPSCPLDPDQQRPEPCMDTHTRIARGAFAAPVLADMDGDGVLDIVQTAFDGKVYVFDGHGEALDGWPVTVHYTGKFTVPDQETEYNRILTTAAVGDFNGDGIPDVLTGSNEKLGPGGNAGAFYLLDGRGNDAPQVVLPNWPLTITSLNLFPLVAEGVANAPVIGNFDGKQLAVVHGNASAPFLVPIDPGDQALLGATPPNAQPPTRDDPNLEGDFTITGLDPTSVFGKLTKAEPDTMFPLFAQPSLGDLDQDGVPDVIASGGSLSLAAALQSSSASDKQQNLLAMWSGKTGSMMPGSPMVLEDFTFFNSQAVVDLNGDDYPEVITGSGGYFLHAYDACGREPDGFPKFTGQWIIPTPAVGDLDGDGTLELAVTTRDGWLYVWHTDATTDSIIEWESFHHDNYNTGNLATPLEQGKKTKAKKPLTIDDCFPPPTTTPTDLVPTGGCSCEAAGLPGGAGGAAWVFAVGLGLAAVRRRRARLS